ncbi:ATP-binding protein [Streptomyces fragilis]|uniref:ATP-binding protein n=1 Tax=Streptomyces fragilis TaxID=67301 RepID=A0ABV2YLI4_9ACTN|nr:ATP-binding protein [Streptomyces fragilis]
MKDTPEDGIAGEATAVRAGLVVLVGPPASGKSSFVRALVARGLLEEDAVVSSDGIRAELFGTSPSEAHTDTADAQIFQVRDRRIADRLADGRTAVAESTNVTPQARTRLIAIARRFDAPVTVLRFDPGLDVLLAQQAGRGRTDVSATDVHTAAAVMARHAGADSCAPKAHTPFTTSPAAVKGSPPPRPRRASPSRGAGGTADAPGRGGRGRRPQVDGASRDGRPRERAYSMTRSTGMLPRVALE